ncbi:hypothetical protein L1887_43588 [Cichorium endivia]|nr:hypothetical protein L1887_43588 [Cichorium endivia]
MDSTQLMIQTGLWTSRKLRSMRERQPCQRRAWLKSEGKRMATANINHTMITWARQRAGYSLSVFAAKCSVTEERLSLWESGEQQVTFNQAMAISDKSHIPFGYLFLPAPPVESLPIPDLRTQDSRPVEQPSAELLDLIKLMQQRQEWYSDYLRQQLESPNPFVGRLSVQHSADAIVRDMRQELDVGLFPERGHSDEYYRVEEFRGFALTDEYAPVIFINHADAPGARLFTLIHELSHIWIGQPGISDGDARSSRKEEILCNAVAAEFLVPADEFVQSWRKDVELWEENLGPLEQQFRVSRWVISRRALTMDFITHEEYARYIARLKAEWLEREKKGGGPGYYRTKKAQISQPFSRAVVGQALSGQLLLREASALLDGIKPAKIPVFAKELGI